MIQDIKLHDAISSYLETTDSSEMTYIFNGPLSLLIPTDQQHNSDEPDLFEGLCTQVYRMSKDTAMDRVRWLFMALTFGDMASALLLGTRLVEDSTTPVPRFATIQQFLVGAESSDFVRTKMMEIEMSLKYTCHTLGVECLFFLEGVVNEDL